MRPRLRLRIARASARRLIVDDRDRLRLQYDLMCQKLQTCNDVIDLRDEQLDDARAQLLRARADVERLTDEKLLLEAELAWTVRR